MPTISSRPSPRYSRALISVAISNALGKNKCSLIFLELGLDGEAVVLRHRGVAVGLRDLGALLVGAAGGVAVAELEVGGGQHAVGVALVVGALEVVGEHLDHVVEAPGLLVLLGQPEHDRRVV